MPSNPSMNNEMRLTNVIYDKTNGKVLGQVRRYVVAQGAFCECDIDEVLSLLRGDEKILTKVTDGTVQNMAVLRTSLPNNINLSRMRVSEKRQTLVRKSRIQLNCDRDVLEGDGEDSITISIDMVNEQNRPQRDFQGEIQVTTTRGKLSARGGRVSIEQGHGSVTLTSVKETVDRVWVRAYDQNNLAIPDTLLLCFE